MKFSSLSPTEQSATIRMNTLALEKRARGERIFNLAAGEPVLTTDAAVIEAAHRAARDGRTLYAPVEGIPELRAAASGWMGAQYGASFEPHECLVSCGGKYGVYAVCQAMLAPGDEVVVIAPYWVSYTAIPALFGARVVVVPTREEDGWKCTPSALRAVITDKTKLLLFNNASNPTGALYTREEVRGILDVAAKRDVAVVSDEVYSGLVYDGREYVSCGSFPEYKDRVAVVQSVSKNFAMTGWRVGFLFGPRELVRTCAALQGQTTSGTATVSQWAAVEAFAQAARITPKVRDAMQARRDALIFGISELFGARVPSPQSALYAFLPLSLFGDMSGDSAAFCTRLLEEKNVATVPGAAFGAEGFVRLSFGETEDELRAALERLSET